MKFVYVSISHHTISKNIANHCKLLQLQIYGQVSRESINYVDKLGEWELSKNVNSTTKAYLKSIPCYLESNSKLIPKICTNLISKYVNNNIPIYTTISNLQGLQIVFIKL